MSNEANGDTLRLRTYMLPGGYQYAAWRLLVCSISAIGTGPVGCLSVPYATIVAVAAVSVDSGPISAWRLGFQDHATP